MKKSLKVIAVGGLAIVVLAAGGFWAVSALRQPQPADYQRLDYQRQAVDASMNVYSPLFSGYTSDYATAFNEKYSAEDQVALKERYGRTLESDRKANLDRLATMRSSVALKEPELQTAFDTYEGAYRAVVDYYQQYAVNLANITESVAGRCDLNSNLNVASSKLSQDYTRAADACLAALGEAKKTSDEPTKKLLSDVEKLVKTRRDAFSKAIDKQGFDGTVANLNALVTLLSINSELKTIQDNYETGQKTTYTRLVNDANDANQGLKAALEPFVTRQGNEA